MADPLVDQQAEKHLLAGLDERERGFSRLIEIEPAAGEYRASFQYERTMIVSHQATKEAALGELIQMLHARGYRQLRSRLSFRAEGYLGSRELWVDYPDPEPIRFPAEGVLAKWSRFWRRLMRS